MSNVYTTAAVPKNLQWWGWGREVTSGTLVNPSLSMPLDKGLPDDKPTILTDKSLRGFMGNDYNDILGTEIADLPVSGHVYLDSIGHPLFNIFGDYQATGTAGSPTWTATGGVTAGAGPITVTTGSVAVQGTFIQVGSAAPTEVVKVGTGSTATSIVIDPTTPIRFNHTGSTTITTVVAPFTHTFSLLNSSTTLGTNVDAQPPSHTITYHNNLAVSTLARQYGYWCASSMDFKLDPEQLFDHDTKGQAILGQIAATAPANTQSGIVAVPDWEFKVGIGGPASGGTLVNNICNAEINIERELKPKFMLNNQQAPYIIGRLGMSITGKLSFLAADESPLLALLNGTQQQLQVTMTQGSGASTLGFTFNAQVAQYETSSIQDPDMLEWDVSFRALMNSTNAGASGGMGPAQIVLVNAVPTY